MITPEHLRLRLRIVRALETLARRDFWLEIELRGNRDYQSFEPDEFIAFVRPWLDSLDPTYADEPIPHPFPATETVEVIIKAYPRHPDYREADLPLVVNPVPTGLKEIAPSGQ